MQELRSARWRAGACFAVLQENAGVLLEHLALALTGARQHQIDAAAVHLMVRARLQSDQAGFGAPLGPHPEQLFGHARRAAHRHPVVILRIGIDRRVVAAFGIDHLAPVHVLPDRLVGIHVALAGNGGNGGHAGGAVVAVEDAVSELAEFFQLLHADLDLAREQMARAAGAAELQHRAENLGLVDLCGP
jgi:hypothetical protein